MSRKRKKTNAADAQVETLVGTEQPTGGAGDGQAAGTAGDPAVAADADAIDATAPADGGDDAGGEDGGAAGDQAPGADDEGGAAAEGDDGGLADELEDAPFKIGDRVYAIDQPGRLGTVAHVDGNTVGAKFEDTGGIGVGDASDFVLVEDEPEGPMDLDILAACAAAAVAFGTRRSNDHTLPTADYGFIAENPPIRAVAECAAEFVRGNGDVSPAVIPIHLGLKGLRPQEPVTHREYAAWTVFAATLKALDTMRRTEAADEEAQARAKEATERRHSAPRDRLALMPEEGALTPSGFTPSR